MTVNKCKDKDLYSSVKIKDTKEFGHIVGKFERIKFKQAGDGGVGAR